MRKDRNRLVNKLNGYNIAAKNRFLLLKDGVLTQEELLLYELIIAITTWDEKKEEYGAFNATNKELAEILNWKSDSTVSRYKKSLIRKQFIIEDEEGFIRAKDFESWQYSKRRPIAKNQDYSAKTQLQLADNQNESAEMQNNQAQKASSSLVSFNENLSLSSHVSDETLSDQELDKIISDIDSENSQLSNETSENFYEEDIVSTAERVFGVKTEEVNSGE